MTDKLLASFECLILEVTSDALIVRMRDLVEELPDEEAELPFEKISWFPHEEYGQGMTFTWEIRQKEEDTEAYSRFVFDEIRVFTQEEIDEAEARAKELSKLFA